MAGSLVMLIITGAGCFVHGPVHKAASLGQRGWTMTLPRNGLRILCIGDDPVRLNLRCSFLQKHGFKVIGSASGYDGLIRFREEVVGAVVLDLEEAALVAGELKRISPEIPIVILITNGQVVDERLQCASVATLRSSAPDGLLAVLNKLSKPRDRGPRKPD